MKSLPRITMAFLLLVLAGGCVTTSPSTCPKPDDPNVLATLRGGPLFMSNMEAEAVRRKFREMPPGCVEYWRRELRR